MQKGHSNTVTQGIRVRVGAQFIPDQSDADRSHYVFAYKVEISNEGETGARLESRHWIILDGLGNRRDVHGPGVVGKHPDLKPGESFEYVSACQLPTEWGSMEGSYRMVRPDGSAFDAAVGRFFLATNLAPLAGVSFE